MNQTTTILIIVFGGFIEGVIWQDTGIMISFWTQEKKNRFPLLDILGYLKNTHDDDDDGETLLRCLKNFVTL